MNELKEVNNAESGIDALIERELEKVYSRILTRHCSGKGNKGKKEKNTQQKSG